MIHDALIPDSPPTASVLGFMSSLIHCNPDWVGVLDGSSVPDILRIKRWDGAHHAHKLTRDCAAGFYMHAFACTVTWQQTCGPRSGPMPQLVNGEKENNDSCLFYLSPCAVAEHFHVALHLLHSVSKVTSKAWCVSSLRPLSEVMMSFFFFFFMVLSQLKISTHTKGDLGGHSNPT